MEERIMVMIGIFLLLGLFLWEKYKRYALERKIDKLVNDLDLFLLNGDINMEVSLEASLDEGRVENLRNQLAAVENQVQHQLKYWEDREKRLNQFMENMAHQMKTSLTSLQIRMDLAQMGASDPKKQAEFLECQKCMTRLTGEVERILECSQLADKKIHMKLERCDVIQLIHKTVSILEPLRIKKEVEIVLDLSDISRISELYLDSYWFSQALENVVKNAIEHTRPGTIVSITARDRINSFLLEVRDEGPGIAENELPFLFERFHRGNYGKAGYGIGLSMARDVLMAHHGSILARNRNNGGACFCMEMPVLDGIRPYETVR